MSWEQFQSQHRVVKLLQATLSHDRLGHAYLFTGPAGVGKSRIALHFAKGILCPEKQGDSCGQCQTCRKIDHGNHPDVHRVLPDGASIKINQVRELQKELAYRAKESKQKVYIIEQADTLTPEAANSILKFLEEPTSHVVAILTTDKRNAILPTILSRCQLVSFGFPSMEQVIVELTSSGIEESQARLASQITVELDRASELCQSKVFAHTQGLVIQLTEDLLHTPNQAWLMIQRIFHDDELRGNIDLFLDLLFVWFNDLLSIQLERTTRVSFIQQMAQLEAQALLWSHHRLVMGLEEIAKTKDRLKRHANPQLTIERLLFHLQEG